MTTFILIYVYESRINYSNITFQVKWMFDLSENMDINDMLIQALKK